MKNKKGVMLLKAAMGMMIAVIAALAMFGSPVELLLSSFDSVRNSFVDLERNIEVLKRGDTKNLVINLKEGEAIIGFDSFAPRVSFEQIQYGQSFLTYINRPERNECSESACICLCKDGLGINWDVSEQPFPLECETELDCRSLSGVDFPHSLSCDNLNGQTENIQISAGTDASCNLQGGFIIGRKDYSAKHRDKFSDSYPVVQYFKTEIHIEKSDDDVIHICAKGPCTN